MNREIFEKTVQNLSALFLQKLVLCVISLPLSSDGGLSHNPPHICPCNRFSNTRLSSLCCLPRAGDVAATRSYFRRPALGDKGAEICQNEDKTCLKLFVDKL